MTASDLHPFKHEALDYTKHSIRLIEVLPDKEVIRCRMRNGLISDEYTCLSYTWGPDNVTHSIHINGQPFGVRSNLWDFLDCARRKFPGETLWIDALCIDQGNNEEKNHQVRQMGDIYSHAALVRSWLGKGDPHIVAAVASIRDRFHVHSEDQNRKKSKKSRQERRRPWPSTRPSSAGNDMEWGIWDAILRLFQNEYWKRAWIVQEITLATKLKLLVGNQEVDWSTFDRFWRLAEEGSDLSIRVPQTHLYRLQRTPVPAFIGDLHFLKAPWVDRSLRSLLKKYGLQLCQDSRDRVFSLLSLAREANDLPVNYDIDRIDLFFKTFAICGNSKCICFASRLVDALGLCEEDLVRRLSGLPRTSVAAGWNQQISAISEGSLTDSVQGTTGLNTQYIELLYTEANISPKWTHRLPISWRGSGPTEPQQLCGLWSKLNLDRHEVVLLMKPLDWEKSWYCGGLLVYEINGSFQHMEDTMIVDEFGPDEFPGTVLERIQHLHGPIESYYQSYDYRLILTRAMLLTILLKAPQHAMCDATAGRYKILCQDLTISMMNEVREGYWIQ